MTSSIKPTEKLSALKQAFLALEEAEAKLAAFEHERNEPIAIIGMGCRFPGGAFTPQVFWKNLCEGRDCVTEVPRDRWDIDFYYDPDPESPGKMSTRWGAFVEEMDRFDAEFFGVTPREARSMDPQQRILMEVAWQALEDAGHASLQELEGSPTGVFVGVTTDDYAQLMMGAQGLEGIDTYFASGTARSIVSGRISYQLGLMGPAVSLDTACSSSLLAVHQACRSLLDQECRMAIAAGVNLILSPANTVALSKYQMMAPDGRCKVFDSAADGFVRGEGCGVVVLKRLTDAQADRDRIYALILGTASNQDGPSSGLTAPNGPSQEAVMRAALKRARVKPGQVEYVEAHGTGTALGDPIEVRALGECYAEGRPADHPLIIGSVKTNIGHLEAAAGIAGLIKTVLVLHHKEIPPNLHFRTPNHEIPWDRYPMMVPTRCMSLATDGNRALAAVTALGFSGTNVHAVLSSAPVQPASQSSMERRLHVVALSARSPEALRRQAAGLSEWFDAAPDSAIPHAAYTLGTGRTHYSHRIAVVGGNSHDLKHELDAYISAEPSSVRSGTITDTQEEPKVAFLFTGQGSQYAGMGGALDRHHPHFRASVNECDEILHPLLGRSIREILYPSGIGEAELINQTIYTQPALFVLEYALARLWWSWGVRPSHVLGHSVGEYVAACIAGALTLEDALQMVVKRSQLMQSVKGRGGMSAVMATEDEVAQRLAQHTKSVSIAAVNGPRQVVISGAAESVERISDSFQKDGVSVVPLNVSHAFHSPLMESVLDRFEASIAGIRFHPPRLRLVSNVTGSVVSQDQLGTAGYWRRHTREPVRFLDGMRTLEEQGCRIFIEIGPQPVLLNMGRQCLESGEFNWLSSLDGKTDDWGRMLASLADAHVCGVSVDWEGFDQPFDRRRISLPTYPFQRRRYWFSQSSAPGTRQFALPDATQVAGGHPLLGMRMDSATGRIHFRSRVGHDRTGFFQDHRVSGTASLPMAAVLEAALAAARLLWPDRAVAQLEQVSMDRAILLPEEAGVDLEWVLEPCPDTGYTFKLFSRIEGQWMQHATGTLRPAGSPAERRPEALAAEPLDTIRRRCSQRTDAEDLYAYFSTIGLDFGPAFLTLETLWSGAREALGRFRPRYGAPDETLGFILSPLVLDGSLQVIAAALLGGKSEDRERVALHLPVGVDHIRLARITEGALWAHATIREGSDVSARSVVCDVRLLDDQSREIAVLTGCRLVPVSADVLKNRSALTEKQMLYHLRWRPRPDFKTSAAEPAVVNGFTFSFEALQERLDAFLPELAHALDFEQYEAARADMDALVSLYIMHALQRMGWQPALGERVLCDSLARKLKVVSCHRQLLKRFLEILAEDGVLESESNGWKVVRSFAGEDASFRGRGMIARGTAGDAELDLIVRCGDRLAEALSGVADPLDLLFRGDAFDSVVRLYSESVTARVFNGLVKKAVAEALRDRPVDRRLRVLEIGAGTGGTTQYVLEALSGRDISYLFTDISPAFVQAAGERFRHYPGFGSQVLDIEKDPVSQGLANGGFDLIIAANVLHATGDLADTLRRVHALAAPGGLLVLLEVTSPQRWVDITFGLTEGWWKFTDRERRRDYPLLSSEQWKTLLAETGFPEVLAVPSPDRTAHFPTLGMQALIVARRDSASACDSKTLVVGTSEPPSWLVLADNDGFGPKFCDGLRAENIRASIGIRGEAFPMGQDGAPILNYNEREDFNTLFTRLWDREELRKGRIGSKIVVLWRENKKDHPGDALSEADDPLARQKTLLSPVLHLLQTLAEMEMKHPPQLVFMTHAAQAVLDNEPVNPAGAALWGMVRAVMIEHPEFRCKMIDVDALTSASLLDPLVAECLAEDAENQVAIRGENRFVLRLEPMQRNEAPTTSEQAFFQQLDITERGLLENLYWRKVPRRSPKKGQVTIGVKATGLNFRDVLNALGTYAGGAVPFGGECTGTVSETGEAVVGLQPGDRVLAIASHSFGSEVIANSHLVWPIPNGMEFEEAAALPIAYTTAAYALQHLAGLRPGQRVLIHAAAGGVGLAAVHMASKIGARLFVTAGSPEKQAYLKRLGIPNVMNSRSLEFAEEIMAATRGEGMDVVLNSLAGDFIEHSLRVTARGGVFLELGRSGIRTPEEVQRSRPDVVYHAIDLTEEMALRPQNVRPFFNAILEQIAAGSLPPLPCKVFSKDETVDAFRYMARAKHIGKVVVSRLGRPSLSQDMPLVRRDGSYWITGGLGALGLFTAEWLAAKGAGHIVLTGRNHPSAAAEKKLAEVRHKGTGVTVMAADVSRRDDVDRVMDAIRKNCPPLRGMFHAAGVLDDGVLRHQDWDRFETVLRPKIAGAWNLHQASQHLSLDFMVLYSSVAGLLGSPGQANHCAANAFMDSLAHSRRGSGLPCLSINWGAWSGAGAAVDGEASSRADLKGVGRFSPEAGLQLLEYLIRTKKTQAVALLVDWGKYIRHTYTDGPAAPLLDELSAPDQPGSTGAASKRAFTPGLLEQLQSAPTTQKAKILTDYVHSEALRILGLDSSDTVDLEKPLHDIGLDSLMAVELRNALGRALNRTLPTTLLFDYPSINSVTSYLSQHLKLEGIQPHSATPFDPEAPESTDDLLSRIEHMQDDDIDRLLSQKAQDSN